ncbi:MAG: ion transporter [Cyclobacteriaceae bacterium]
MEGKDFKRFPGLRSKLYTIVFGTETPAGKLFDVVLLWAIVGSILVVTFESVKELNDRFESAFAVFEWVFTILFSIEYLLRIFILKKPLKYVFSFLGIIDFLALVPTYLSLFVTGGAYLVVIRAIRLLRIFRILKLSRYLSEAQMLGNALVASKYKLFVFIGTVLSVVLIVGTLMYVIEGAENGFTSIPRSIYWCIVTITTVGYGDIAPHTILGQILASVLMLMGYAIIAVPTGIVTGELVRENTRKAAIKLRSCHSCDTEIDDPKAKYCQECGNKLP